MRYESVRARAALAWFADTFHYDVLRAIAFMP
jgi:hypothetical protein